MGLNGRKWKSFNHPEGDEFKKQYPKIVFTKAISKLSLRYYSSNVNDLSLNYNKALKNLKST
jgi:hypothetical protein